MSTGTNGELTDINSGSQNENLMEDVETKFSKVRRLIAFALWTNSKFINITH